MLTFLNGSSARQCETPCTAYPHREPERRRPWRPLRTAKRRWRSPRRRPPRRRRRRPRWVCGSPRKGGEDPDLRLFAIVLQLAKHTVSETKAVTKLLFLLAFLTLLLVVQFNCIHFSLFRTGGESRLKENLIQIPYMAPIFSSNYIHQESSSDHCSCIDYKHNILKLTGKGIGTKNFQQQSSMHLCFCLSHHRTLSWMLNLKAKTK